MTREISGHCTLADGETLTLELCDKYHRSLGRGAVEMSVGEEGAFSGSLEVSQNDECYCAVNVTPKKYFWVHEGSLVQELDLREEIYPYPVFPTLGNGESAAVMENVECLVGRVMVGEPVTSNEEVALVCGIGELDTSEDSRVCLIDEKIMES